MKSYTDTVCTNEPRINWKEFLTQNNISESEWETAKLISKMWQTCSVGVQSNIIPRIHSESSYKGQPEDTLMKDLGISFHGAITAQNQKDAKNIYDLVTLRANYLVEIQVSNKKERIKTIQENLQKAEQELAEMLQD
jgi:hypothetical protein